nr:Dihydrofolate reductase [uncultured bacterium]
MVGRKTFESIGKPLPGRQMIIVTRSESIAFEGCFIVRSVEAAIDLARERGESELFVCGGAEIYAQTLGAADRIYLTLVHADCDADTFFPEWNSDDWIEMESEHRTADEKNQHPFTFKTFARKSQV